MDIPSSVDGSDLSRSTLRDYGTRTRVPSNDYGRMDVDERPSRQEMSDPRARSQQPNSRPKVIIRSSTSTPRLAPTVPFTQTSRRPLLGQFPVNPEFSTSTRNRYPLQGVKYIFDDGHPNHVKTLAKQHERSLSMDSYLADRAFERITISTTKHLDCVLGRNTFFNDLPEEIHELILDNIVGLRADENTSKSSNASCGWNLRHLLISRLSSLSLVCRTWRRSIQARLYRHVKIKGTAPALKACEQWFHLNPHLVGHVRHFEVWFPVWEKLALDKLSYQGTFGPEMRVIWADGEQSRISAAPPGIYKQSSRNVSLCRVLNTIKDLFKDVHTITLEGGHCKNSKMIEYFDRSNTIMPILDNVHTLILKGSYNIIREANEVEALFESFPNVRQWHASYARASKESYSNMTAALRQLPLHLATVNISLESFASNESRSLEPGFVANQCSNDHLCASLGAAVAQFESLTFSGTICSCFFQYAAQSANRRRDGSPLKSLDLLVKNCCRPLNTWNTSASVMNMAFVKSFTQLVVSGVEALESLRFLDDVRIRFVDLDAPSPFINPYFHLHNNVIIGLWNEEILSIIERTRPNVSYLHLRDDLSCLLVEPNGSLKTSSLPRSRPLSIYSKSYRRITSVLHI